MHADDTRREDGEFTPEAEQMMKKSGAGAGWPMMPGSIVDLSARHHLEFDDDGRVDPRFRVVEVGPDEEDEKHQTDSATNNPKSHRISIASDEKMIHRRTSKESQGFEPIPD